MLCPVYTNKKINNSLFYITPLTTYLSDVSSILIIFNVQVFICHNNIVKGFDFKVFLFLGPLTYTLSRQGGKVLHHQGFTYSVWNQRYGGMKKMWRCSKKRSKGCKGVLYTVGDQIIQFKNSHCHDPEFNMDR